jgi:hypothetical protein
MTEGYKERNRGGLTVYDLNHNDILYDYKNNLLNYPNRVWCVFRIAHCDSEWDSGFYNILDGVFESYDEAFDRAHRIDGALAHWDVKKK